MPWLVSRKEAGGKYTLYWSERVGTDPTTGRGIFKTFSEATGQVRLSDAKRYKAKWERDRAEGTAKPTKTQIIADNPEWDAYWCLLESKLKGNYRTKSWDAKVWAWKHATRAFKPSRLSDISHDDVVRLRDNWTLSDETFNDLRRNMSWIYAVGRKKAYRDKGRTETYRLHNVENPWENVRPRETFKKHLEILTVDQVEALITHAVEYSKGTYTFAGVEYPCPNVWTMFVLLGYCGLRSGEAENARWEWINWKQQTFTVTQTADFKTKGKKNRTLPLFGSVARWLEPIKQTSGYIFQPEVEKITEGYGRAIEYRSSFRQVCKLGGFWGDDDKPTIWPHLFRHSWITNLLHKGVSAHEVAEWSGHSSLWVQQIYIQEMAPKPGRTALL